MQNLNELSVHPLLNGRLVYSLPSSLVSRVIHEVGRDQFNSEAVRIEDMLAESFSPPLVGFWNNRAIRNYWLAPLTPVSVSDSGLPGWSEEFTQTLAESTGLLEKKLNAMREPVLGYAGWLLTNRQFLEEHDRLLQRHAALIAQNGVLRSGAVGRSAVAADGTVDDMSADQRVLIDWELAVESSILNPTSQRGESSWTQAGRQTLDSNDPVIDFSKDFTEFYIRWRLEDMDAPYAPNPLVPQFPVLHLPVVLGHMKEGGQTYYIPDTFPVQSRDQLRSLIEDTLRPKSATAGHLTEWHAIVDSSQPAKNRVARFARLHLLQHYVRQLYARHSDALHGAKTRLYVALGEHFKVGADAIKDDFSLISDRLGSGWEEEVRAF